jgi:4'-phosphopantetheinyl transferase
VRFNVAHADDLAVYALTRNRDLGVDVERIASMPDATEIAVRFFAAAEIEALRALPPRLIDQAFFVCWTRKEAYIKALGDGLAHPLDQFAVSLAPGEPPRLSAVGDANGREVERWRLAAVPPAPGYVAALAGRGHGWRLATRSWPLHS